MLRNLRLAVLLAISIAFFFSCAASPAARESGPYSRGGGRTPGTLPSGAPSAGGPETGMPPETSPGTGPERPGRPEIPEYIMGEGRISYKDLGAFLLSANPAAGKTFAENLAFIYTEEAAAEGVNHDAAFAQMCLETGFLKFGGLVTPDMNNFCGLGSTGPGEPGARFANPRLGVRAHIQHLKAYASERPLNGELVDPRFRYVRRASVETIQGLAGTWATDRSYAEKINGILERLYAFSFGD